jgi:integrase
VLNVSPKTLERYSELIRVHVRPNLGAIPIQKLQAAHLAGLYSKLVRDGLSPRTAGHVHRVVHKALAVAVQWNIVSRNVAGAAEPPKVPAAEIEILSEDAARLLLQKLRGRSLYMLALLGLTTGMRRGELLALRWSDVDLDGAKLTVELNRADEGGRSSFQESENQARAARHRLAGVGDRRAASAPEGTTGAAVAPRYGQDARRRPRACHLGGQAALAEQHHQGVDPCPG